MQAPDLVQAQLSAAPASATAAGTPGEGDGAPFPDLMRSSLDGDGTNGGKGQSPVDVDDGKNLPLAATPAAAQGAATDAGDGLVADSALAPDPALAAMMQRFSSDPHRVTSTTTSAIPATPDAPPSGVVSDATLTPAPATEALMQRFSSDPHRPLTLPTDTAAFAGIGTQFARAAPSAGRDALDNGTLAQAAAKANAGAQRAVAADAAAPALAASIGVAMADAALSEDGRDALELRLESGSARTGSTLPGLSASGAPGGTTQSAVSAPATSYQAVVHAGSASSVAMWDHAIGQQLMGMIERGQQHARLKLHPAELGQIDIRLNLGADRVDLNFTVQQPAVAHALQHGMPQLAQMFSEHGLSLGQAQVAQQDAGQGRGEQQGNAGPTRPDADLATDAGESVAGLRIAARGLLDAFA